MPPSVSPCVGRDHAYLANAIAVCAPPADFLVVAIHGRGAELPRSDRTGSTARGLDGATGGQPLAADPRRTTVGTGTRQRVASARSEGRASPTLVRGAADLRQRIARRGGAARDLVGPSVPRRHSGAGGSHPTGGAARRPARGAGAAAPRRAAAGVLASECPVFAARRAPSRPSARAAGVDRGVAADSGRGRPPAGHARGESQCN